MPKLPSNKPQWASTKGCCFLLIGRIKKGCLEIEDLVNLLKGSMGVVEKVHPENLGMISIIEIMYLYLLDHRK